MGILGKIKRHAAVATGNFESMFKDTVEIPPLPTAAARLVAEFNRPEPEIERLDTMLSSLPDLAATLIVSIAADCFKTGMASMFALRD